MHSIIEPYLGESRSPFHRAHSRLLRVADAAVQGCDVVPPPQPPLPNRLDLIARVACNGEVMWARSHAHAALRALSSAGFNILGLDLRKFPPGGGTHEAPWSSLEAADLTTHLDAARESLNGALQSDLIGYPWVLITYSSAARSGSDLLGPDLTNGEIELLSNELTDHVSFDMSLIHLGIRQNRRRANDR